MMKLNNYIEHTVLKPSTSDGDVVKLCEEALAYNFAGVCVPPYYVKKAYDLMADSSAKVVTVIGFPLGYQATPAKVEEAKKAMEEGADELDMVINIAAVKSGDFNYVKNDIVSVVNSAHLKGKEVKVIIETALLTEEEKVKLCEICVEAEADYVKTSTGFADGGATLEDIQLMRKVLPDNVKIKASGGIKTKTQARALVEAGANRLGTSSGIKLVK